MGLFGGKTKSREMNGLPLRQGTQIPLVDVDAQFVEQARQRYPKQSRIGHAAPVAVIAKGSDIHVLYEGHAVARMTPDMARVYLPEFQRLHARGYIGLTDAWVKPAGAKSPHALALNWGQNAYDGGIV